MLEASLHIILSSKRTSKALISLQGCAGWPAPLLSANPEARFSRGKAQVHMDVRGMLQIPYSTLSAHAHISAH